MKYFKMYFDSPNGGGCYVGSQAELEQIADWFKAKKPSLLIHEPEEISKEIMEWMLSKESVATRVGRSAEPASEFLSELSE